MIKESKIIDYYKLKDLIDQFLKCELVFIEEEKIYATANWNSIIEYNQNELEDWMLRLILNNIIEGLSKSLSLGLHNQITRLLKIVEGKNLPYGYLKHGVVTGEEKKLGSKRIILFQNGFWKEIAFVENFRERSFKACGAGFSKLAWGKDEGLIDYEEFVPDKVLKIVSLNSFKKGESNE